VGSFRCERDRPALSHCTAELRECEVNNSSTCESAALLSCNTDREQYNSGDSSKEGISAMRAFVVVLILALASTVAPEVEAQSCGIKPIPNIGCRIGRCVNGAWEQICDQSPAISCGIKPIPQIGCRIGRCVDGAWEQICDQSPSISCGIKPIPNIGCHIGRCVNGAWEQVCN